MTPKTCSKESGAKLQALGVRVESAFRWKEAKEEYALMGLQVDLVYGFGVHQKYLHQYMKTSKAWKPLKVMLYGKPSRKKTLV